MNLTRQSIISNNEQEWLALRLEDITSTEVSALFNLSPYQTEFELWHRKKNKEIVTIEANQRMKWGTRLQDSIARGIAEDNGWNVRRMDEYVRIPELRIGSSFARGALVAQAAHIPVHLGSLPRAVEAALALGPFRPGDHRDPERPLCRKARTCPT